MKVAFVYGPMSIGARPLDFSRLYDDPRGMTGSELSCVEYARHMARRGHDVTLIVCQAEGPSLFFSPDVLDGIAVKLGVSNLVELAAPGVWDAICVWNEPDLLRGADPRAVRLVNQQLNDWTYCRSGWEEFVDVATSPSEHHKVFIGRQASVGWSKWQVLPNGCDPSLYSEGHRVPGRVLWASSPDRGLHLLLQAWPLIRGRVPHATLHALYNFQPGPLLEYEEGSIGLNGLPVTPDIQELAQRYRYIACAMERLKDHGVSAIGSVSRKRMVQEMYEAVVLGYPCDTIRYTEGFSVTTMEACAAGLVPVISSEDALGSIYSALPTVLPTPISSYMGPFVELVVGALEGNAFAVPAVGEGRRLAAAHAWPILAERLEQILMVEMDKKYPRFGNPEAGLLVTRKVVLAPDVAKIVQAAERGPYEVEGNPAPPGARVAEWYVNHHYHGHKTMRYWTSWDIMVGGTIYDKAEWEYLKRRYALTHIVNVESEHSDEGKDIPSVICEAGRQADDASPRRHDDMLAVLRFAAAASSTYRAPKFYVHCQMGGSRSPAYAYLLLRGLKGMTRVEALAEIRRTRPEYAGLENPGHHVAYLKSADDALQSWRSEGLAREISELEDTAS